MRIILDAKCVCGTPHCGSAPYELRFASASDSGNPEPVTIGKDGEPALDVRTITFETRVVEDDEDKVLRRTMHATSASALQAQAASATAKVKPCPSLTYC